MKTNQLAFLLSALLLVSCSGSVSSSEPLSSSSSSAPSSTSASTSLDPVAGQLVKAVGQAASKYNGGLSIEAVAMKAGVALEAPSTYGNLLLLLQAGFSDSMPELKGQRKYGGYFSLPENVIYRDPAVKKALEWLVSYGLWGNDFFDEDELVSDYALETIIARFYTYFGTNQKDDFFAAVNHDYLYEQTEDATLESNAQYFRTQLMNSGTAQTNCVSYASELASSSSKEAPFYQTAKRYYEGTLDYSFLTDEKALSAISSRNAISSLDDWALAAESSLLEFGGCELVCFAGVNEIGQGDVVLASVGKYATFATDYASVEEETTQGLIPSVLGLGFPVLEATSLAKTYMVFQNATRDIYNTEPYKSLAKKPAYLISPTTGQDLFEQYGIDLDLKGLLLSGGFTDEEIKKIVTVDSGALLSLGKSLLSASVEQLRALSLVEYSFNNYQSMIYAKGTPQTSTAFIALIENNLAADYMATSDYSDSFAALLSLFNGIKTVFGERISSSSWLSEEGKAAAQEKLDALQYTMAGKSSDGTYLNYEDRRVSLDGTIRAAFARRARNQMKITLSEIVDKLKPGKLTLLGWQPFSTNAFYMQDDNTINITFGAIFCVDKNLQSVSKEQLYGQVGFVLGHEVTHGFDSQGVFYDKNGAKGSEGIIPKTDMANFSALAQKVADLYRREEVLPGLVQESNNTITETMADLGGISFMEALGQKDPSFSFQEFYAALAGAFGTKTTRSMYLTAFRYDVHPILRARCNAPLRNSELFQKTYGLVEGDGMYMDSAKRVLVW